MNSRGQTIQLNVQMLGNKDAKSEVSQNLTFSVSFNFKYLVTTSRYDCSKATSLEQTSIGLSVPMLDRPVLSD